MHRTQLVVQRLVDVSVRKLGELCRYCLSVAFDLLLASFINEQDPNADNRNLQEK